MVRQLIGAAAVTVVSLCCTCNAQNAETSTAFSSHNQHGATASAQVPATRTITDMAGRKVRIPVKITRIICNDNPSSASCYIVAPDKIVHAQARPMQVGAGHPQEASHRNAPPGGMVPNYESYIALHPDIVLDGCGKLGGEVISNAAFLPADTLQEKLGSIPVVCLDSDINHMEANLKFMGEVLNVKPRANALAAYYRSVVSEVKAKVDSIPKKNRIRVYYAEGSDGLQTNPSGSGHTQLLEFCGGVNVATNDLKHADNMIAVTDEMMLTWNPDVVITASPRMIQQMARDETWQEIKAVKTHRVYLIPNRPFNWFDRPPGANRIVGIPWLAHALYPNLFSDEWYTHKIKEFYKLAYQTELSDNDLKSLTTP